MITPTLTTERLILRPFKMSDAEEIFSSWSHDPEVSRYMLWSPSQSVDETKAWLKSDIESNKKDDYYNFGFQLKSTGELLGNGGLTFNCQKNCFELFYGIKKSAWHKGFTTEAMTKIVQFAKEELNASELYACHADENPNSGKVMEKLGFIYKEKATLTKFDNSVSYSGKGYFLYL